MGQKIIFERNNLLSLLKQRWLEEIEKVRDRKEKEGEKIGKRKYFLFFYRNDINLPLFLLFLLTMDFFLSFVFE